MLSDVLAKSLKVRMAPYEQLEPGLADQFIAFLKELPLAVVADGKSNPTGVEEKSNPPKIHVKTNDFVYLGTIHSKNNKGGVGLDGHAYLYFDHFAVNASDRAGDEQRFLALYRDKLLGCFPLEQTKGKRTRKSIKLSVLLGKQKVWREAIEAYIELAQ